MQECQVAVLLHFQFISSPYPSLVEVSYCRCTKRHHVPGKNKVERENIKCQESHIYRIDGMHETHAAVAQNDR